MTKMASSKLNSLAAVSKQRSSPAHGIRRGKSGGEFAPMCSRASESNSCPPKVEATRSNRVGYAIALDGNARSFSSNAPNHDFATTIADIRRARPERSLQRLLWLATHIRRSGVKRRTSPKGSNPGGATTDTDIQFKWRFDRLRPLRPERSGHCFGCTAPS